jgi:benzoyl-CoA reductase subunit C
MKQNGASAFEALNETYEKKMVFAQQLKEQGKKIIGYLCYFAPPELVSAAGLIPCRIMGQLEDRVSEADDYVEPLGCPYVRNCFDQALKGKLDFLDGIIVPHSCDAVQRIYGIWKYHRRPEYSYLFNVPHSLTPWSRDFFHRELTFFKESLENYVGATISDEKIRQAIDLYNENRQMVQDLYALRKQDPPQLTGSEIFKIMITGMFIAPEEFNVLLRGIKKELGDRAKQPNKLPRIMFWGSILDDVRLFEWIEEAGSYVVTDDTCIGTRSYLRKIDPSSEPMDAFTRFYFEDFLCPRTDRGPSVERFEYISDLIRDFHVQGVIGYTLSFCDPHKLDFPDLRDYLAQKGIPVLHIDDDYTLSNMAALKNRIDPFLEMLSR